MDEARHLIESIVNLLLINDPETLARAQRNSTSNPIIRYDQEWDGPWRANVAASNCYRGSKENVGWHADQVKRERIHDWYTRIQIVADLSF
jgi:hypothetical protein